MKIANFDRVVLLSDKRLEGVEVLDFVRFRTSLYTMVEIDNNQGDFAGHQRLGHSNLLAFTKGWPVQKIP